VPGQGQVEEGLQRPTVGNNCCTFGTPKGISRKGMYVCMYVLLLLLNFFKYLVFYLNNSLFQVENVRAIFNNCWTALTGEM